MKIAFGGANTVPFNEPGPARDLAQAAEEAGVESLWTVEHVIWPTNYDSTYPYHPSGKMPGDPSIPIPDPLVWLTWVGAATTTLRLGTGVIILPQRNPLVLAKEAATVDALTGGRLELGVGVGWLREEFEALQVPFEQRGKRTDEMIEAMRALWRSDDASFSGQHVAFDNVALNPKPVAGSIPIVVGGHSKAAARRAARFGDGFYPGPGSMDGLRETISDLHQACEAIGRDPAEVEVTAVYPGRFFDDPQGRLDELADAGVHRTMLWVYELARLGLEDSFSIIAELT